MMVSWPLVARLQGDHTASGCTTDGFCYLHYQNRTCYWNNTVMFDVEYAV